jgi:ACS family hexuronate transporter-like MFS transporter
MRGVGDWFHSENRAKAVGLFLCGVSIGALLTPPIVAWLTLRHGWRASFLVTGALGFLLIPIWLLLHKRIQQVYGTPDPAPAYHSEERSGEPTREDLSLKEVFRQRKYWFVLGARCVTDSVWFFYLFWIPGYFQEVRNLDLAMVGKLLWIPFFSADIGALFGAWTSSGLIQRGLGLDRSRKLVLIPSALLCVSGAGAFFVPTHILSLGLVSLALFGMMSWAANLSTAITEITPRQHVAVLYGITGAAGTLTAAITQPLIGHLVDSMGYKIPFVMAGTSFLLAIALLLGAGKIEQMRRMGPGAEPSVVTSGVA